MFDGLAVMTKPSPSCAIFGSTTTATVDANLFAPLAGFFLIPSVDITSDNLT